VTSQVEQRNQSGTFDVHDSDDLLAARVRGLVKTYGDLRAVDGLDLDVARGECLAVLGPNGAGKTTTTEILEGFRTRDAGDVQVLGSDPQHNDPLWRNRIGIVLQSIRDLGEITVEEAVRHFAQYYSNPRNPDEVIEAVGLREKRKARNGQLSGGQRRRLDVALGIIGRPELLFLDEPTTGFDPQARRQFWDLITDLRADGTTILLTTHYLEEAEVLADRVAVIARGRILACDTPEKLGGRAAGLAHVMWSEAGESRSHATAEPTLFVTELARRLDSGGEIPELQVIRPSLEDVYLQLIDTDNDEVAS
jgi:ABC-2 type transport system ATP-binding protein